MKVSFQHNDAGVPKESKNIKPVSPSVEKTPAETFVAIKPMSTPERTYDLNGTARKFMSTEDARERYLAQNTQCKISSGSSHTPKASGVRRKSSAMIGKRTIQYVLRINYGDDISIDDNNENRITKFNPTGVDLLIDGGNGTVVTIPLPVDVRWNVQKQRATIDGKILNSAKVVRRGNSYSFEYDSKELNSALDHQIWALLYKYQNKSHEDGLTDAKSQLDLIDRNLNHLKRQGRLDAETKKSYFSTLTKFKTLLGEFKDVLDVQRGRLAKARGQKSRFTQEFQTALKSWNDDYDSLKRTYDAVKKRLDSILWNWWYKFYTAPRRSGGC